MEIKNKKSFAVLVIGCLILILFIQSIFALGVVPGKRTYGIEDVGKEFSFTVLNSEEKDMNVEFSVNGYLKDIIELNKKEVHFSSSEKSKTFTYRLKRTPAIYMRPGENVGRIVIREIAEDEEVTPFSALPGVSTEISIFRLHPNKYLDSRVEILEAGENEVTEFSMPVINRGEEGINSLEADIKISKEDVSIDNVKSEEISLESLERKDLSAEWVANVPEGVYKATIDFIYDDEIATYYRNFKVGDVEMNVSEIFVEDFELGSIVTLNVLVENSWNEELKEVYANLVLYDKSNKKVVDVNSAPYDIPASEKEMVKIYWDTSDIKEGVYNGFIKIITKESVSKQGLKVIITSDGISLELESNEFILGGSKQDVIIWVIIILLIGIGITMRLLKNMSKKRK